MVPTRADDRDGLHRLCVFFDEAQLCLYRHCKEHHSSDRKVDACFERRHTSQVVGMGRVNRDYVEVEYVLARVLRTEEPLCQIMRKRWKKGKNAKGG